MGDNLWVIIHLDVLGGSTLFRNMLADRTDPLPLDYLFRGQVITLFRLLRKSVTFNRVIDYVTAKLVFRQFAHAAVQPA